MEKRHSSQLARLVNGITAIVFGLSVTAPVLMINPLVSAQTSQVQSRSVSLSDSSASGGSITSGVGSGTNVTYQFQFTTTVAAQSLIIDFCSNTPLIGDSCTAPTGFSTSSATASKPSGASSAIGTWTITKSTNQVKLAGTSAQAAGVQSFNINGITNPSTENSYYARVTTYADGTFGGSTTAYSSATSPGDYKEYGGLAMSTSNTISITARVMETLQFCVLNVTPTAACANADGTNLPNITIGHGTNKVLDGSAVDTAQVYSQLSTNAYHGAVIDAHLNNACGGLSRDGGTTCNIGAVNNGGSTPTAIQPGNTGGKAVFGLNVTNGTGDVGTITADANYSGSNVYGMDTTTAGGQNVTGTFGDQIASSTGPTANVNNTYTFAATAIPTTPAGIYNAEMSLIATGTF